MDKTQENPAENGLMRATATFASLTFLSRVLGMIRDMIIATTFGAAGATDAFWVAFRIPNLFRRIFAEGSFSQAFVPVLADKKQEPIAEQRQFISAIAGNLASALLPFCLIVMILAPYLVHLFAPGFAQHRFELVSHMLRITFPYLALISFTALASAILNSYQRFAAPAFTPVFLNLSLIASALWLKDYTYPTITALAWGVLLAGILQLSWQLPFLSKLNLCVRPSIDWKNPDVRRVLTLMIPTLIAASVSQINLFIDNIFASFLPVGSISWLYYSDRLMQLPLGMLGVGISTVCLPKLSQHHALGEQQKFRQDLDWAFRTILLLAIPAASALAFLAKPLLITLFQYGHFTQQDALMASQSLRAFAFGLTAFMLVKTASTAFFAKKTPRIATRVAYATMLLNIILNVVFIKPFAHAGLALATSCAAWFNSLALIILLLWRGDYRPSKQWFLLVLQILVGNVCMLGALAHFTPSTQTWIDWSLTQRAQKMGMLVLLGAATYFLFVWVVGGFKFSYRKK